MIQVGFGKADVTPPLGQPLGRLFRNDMVAERVQWPLQVACMAIDDGDCRVLVLSVDKNRLLDPAIAEIRAAVATATGLPAAHLFIACTHAHNVPFAMDWLPGSRTGFAYLDVLKQAACQAALAALGSRCPASLYTGRAAAPGLAVNRRPIFRTAYGEQVGTHGPQDHADFLRFESLADDEVLLLIATDDSARALGGLVNFACHPTTMYNESAWSADFPGAMVAALARELGGTFLFLNGAAGDVSPDPAVLPGRPGADRAQAIGDALARAVIGALPAKQPVSGRLAVQRRQLRIPQRRPTEHQIDLARRWVEDGPDPDLSTFCRRFYGYSYTMYRMSEPFQNWLCRDLLGMWEWQRRAAQREPADDLDMCVIALGNFALAGFPSEIFCDFGRKVKRESPLPQTMVAELANGWHGYIPISDAFGRGGYETSFAYQSRLIPEAGELMCATSLALLSQAAATATQGVGAVMD